MHAAHCAKLDLHRPGPCRKVAIYNYVMLQELKAEVQRLGGDITLKAAAASEQQAVMSRLQEQMGDSSASVLALSHDLSSTKETHSTALQVLFITFATTLSHDCEMYCLRL